MNNICYVNHSIVTIYDTTDTVKKQTFKATENMPEQTLEVSAIADEGLYGMPLLILEESGDWYKVRTHYSYEGYVLKSDVIFKDELEAQMVVNGQYADVLNVPKVQGVPLISLTRGCLLEVLSEMVNGYRKVVLLDGRMGYIPEKFLSPKLFKTDAFLAEGTAADDTEFSHYLSSLLDTYFEGSEKKFRDAVTKTALSYMGTQYRWGGKTPLGIDCSGTTSMSYMLNGVLTYRDARIVEGYPVKEIPREKMQKGDLLYFAGHIAMYLGDDQYVHSTGKIGSNGVDINSFNPEDTNYRKDLDEGLLKVGTIFW